MTVVVVSGTYTSIRHQYEKLRYYSGKTSRHTDSIILIIIHQPSTHPDVNYRSNLRCDLFLIPLFPRQV